MGDPAGVGPEIALKALSSTELPPDLAVVVIGDLWVMTKAAALVPGMSVEPITNVSDAQPGTVSVFDTQSLAPGSCQIGKVDAACGRASYRYILTAIDLAKRGVVDGVVTNPINKEALKAAGIDFPGHTEIFAHETDTTTYSMMFMLEKVAVVHVTTHCSLRAAIELVRAPRVSANIRLLNDALGRLGVARPRIAVGGLNPHAGENGLFGDEERKEIVPAIEQCRSEGIDVSGPYPPDTVFMRAFRGEFDGVVSMLHDHGFVALKSKNFEEGVNITIGLPVIRTSVGHGTAFDIAGKGIASERSLVAALLAAYKMATFGVGPS